MRKILFWNLEVRQLNLWDIISLLVFLAIDIGRFVLNILALPEMYKFFYDLSVAFLIYIILTMPFAMRFRNFTFSLIWFILSLIYILEGDRTLSCVGVALLALYQIIRNLFIEKYERELIPPVLGRGWYIDSYNKQDGIKGGKEDARYFKIFAYLGIAVVLICLVASGKKD